MDIQNVWQQSSGSDDELNRMLQQNDFSNVQSKLPLGKLKKNLLIGIIWAAVITAVYIALFFFVNIWQVYVALGTLILFNIWIAVDSLKLYKSINVNISAKNSLKEELQKNYIGFQRWWTLQQRASLFVYPVALTGGFILGGFLGSDKPVESFLYNPRMLLILGITILIVMPLCYFGAKWMFNYAYGKHLKKLESTIDELS
jgi:hypothetical protein